MNDLAPGETILLNDNPAHHPESSKRDEILDLWNDSVTTDPT